MPCLLLYLGTFIQLVSKNFEVCCPGKLTNLSLTWLLKLAQESLLWFFRLPLREMDPT